MGYLFDEHKIKEGVREGGRGGGGGGGGGRKGGREIGAMAGGVSWPQTRLLQAKFVITHTIADMEGMLLLLLLRLLRSR